MKFNIKGTELLGSGGSAGLRFQRLMFRNSGGSRIEFYEMMSALLSDGKPLDGALRVLLRRYQARKNPMAEVLQYWLGRLDEGTTFAVALKGYAPDTELTLISASERGGNLAAGLQEAAETTKALKRIIGIVRSEMTQPIIQMAALVAILVGFSNWLAPQLSSSVPDWAMSGVQRALFRTADVVREMLLPTLAVVAAITGAAIWSMPNYTGALRPFLNRLPPWSIYKLYSASTFMVSLSSLIRAGVPIESAITFIGRQSSPYVADHMALMRSRLRAGVEQGEALDTGLLSERLADLVAVYASTARFDSAIETAGKVAIEAASQDIKSKTAVARVGSLSLVAAVVLWIYISLVGIGEAAKRATEHPQSAAEGVVHLAASQARPTRLTLVV